MVEGGGERAARRVVGRAAGKEREEGSTPALTSGRATGPRALPLDGGRREVEGNQAARSGPPPPLDEGRREVEEKGSGDLATGGEAVSSRAAGSSRASPRRSARGRRRLSWPSRPTPKPVRSGRRETGPRQIRPGEGGGRRRGGGCGPRRRQRRRRGAREARGGGGRGAWREARAGGGGRGAAAELDASARAQWGWGGGGGGGGRPMHGAREIWGGRKERGGKKERRE
ncbi:hypothetical protein PR202_gb18871 [Eleusine coracana subsp. coracana]|uniref:Uncharacterized protein n=1 Tax=Eleusine coracana subsp. coracana TaxID=191504 RepID=A0AAV5F6R9_ELECO|nr:hypothetical protein PR202_gb18871 [Eleusine coracana subsp. coracana]